MNEELQRGVDAAAALVVAHMKRMGASAGKSTVTVDGTKYIITVEPEDKAIDLPFVRTDN